MRFTSPLETKSGSIFMLESASINSAAGTSLMD